MTCLIILIGLLAYAVLTQWVAGAWAWAAFQVGIFSLAAAWIVQRTAQSAQLCTAPPSNCWNKPNFEVFLFITAGQAVEKMSRRGDTARRTAQCARPRFQDNPGAAAGCRRQVLSD